MLFSPTPRAKLVTLVPNVSGFESPGQTFYLRGLMAREREREREHRRVLKVRTRPQSGLRAAIAAATGRIENDRARERTLISRRVSPFLSTRRAIAIFEKFARTDFPNYGEGFKHPCALTISIFYCRAYEIIHFKRRVERRAKN